MKHRYSSVRDLLAVLPLAELERDAGIRPNTIVTWRKREAIPARNWPALVEFARARRIPLTLDDIAAVSPPVSPRPKRKEPA